MDMKIAIIHLESMAESKEITLLEQLSDIRTNPDNYSPMMKLAYDTFMAPLATLA